jgi:hypothetical protein
LHAGRIEETVADRGYEGWQPFLTSAAARLMDDGSPIANIGAIARIDFLIGTAPTSLPR